MDDEKIVDLYWARKEEAISRTDEKYGPYLFKIAYNILADSEDSHESVNDTYLKAWNSMPPARPGVLSTYLGKITRHLSIDIYRMKHRQKRVQSEYVTSLSELSDCVSGGNQTEEIVDVHMLADALNSYLATLQPQVRNVFIGRYYFMDPLKDIAAYYGMSIPKIKSMLFRTRQGLKEYLRQEGFEI